MCTYRFFISCCLGLVEEGSVSLKLLLGELPGDWLMIVVSLITRNTTETDIKTLLSQSLVSKGVQFAIIAKNIYGSTKH